MQTFFCATPSLLREGGFLLEAEGKCDDDHEGRHQRDQEEGETDGHPPQTDLAGHARLPSVVRRAPSISRPK